MHRNCISISPCSHVLMLKYCVRCFKLTFLLLFHHQSYHKWCFLVFWCCSRTFADLWTSAVHYDSCIVYCSAYLQLTAQTTVYTLLQSCIVYCSAHLQLTAQTTVCTLLQSCIVYCSAHLQLTAHTTVIIIIITLFWVQKSRNSSVDYTFKRMNVVSQWGSILHLCNITIQSQIHNKIHIWIGTFKVVYEIVQVGTNCLVSLNTD